MAYNHLGQDPAARNQTPNSTEQSALVSMGNTTDAVIIASVELYTVILVFLILLTASVFGALTNMALLLSIKCKRSIRNLHYALPFSLSATNLAACVLWMAVHIVQLVQNQDQSGAWPSVCYLNVISFHLSVGVIVFTTVFIATQRLYRLLQTTNAHIGRLVVVGLSASWIGAVIVALAMVLQFDNSVDYAICIHGYLTNLSEPHFSHSTVAAVIFSFYILVLFVTLVTMAVLVIVQKHHLAMMVLKRSRGSRFSVTENNRHQDDGKRPSMAGDTSVPTTSSIEPTEPARKVSQTFIPIQDTFRPGRVPLQQSQAEDVEDEDEDTFDMKMRDRWQKTGSGRRHTVANIGVRDTLFGPRRGSLGDAKPAPSNYHYVRKWSVDIVALQDQLENPKLNTSSNPFPGLAILKEKDKEKPAEELLEEAEEAAEEKAAAAAAADMTPTTDTESKHEEEIEDINDSTEPLQSSQPPVPCVYGNQHDGNPGAAGDAGNNDEIKRLEKELARCTKYMLLLTVSLLSVLPYAVLQLLQGSMSPHNNRNASYVLAAVCILQCPLHPVILAWLDSRLSSALSRLRIKLTHWRCVCYCNIGQGKWCLGRHRKHNIAEEVPDS